MKDKTMLVVAILIVIGMIVAGIVVLIDLVG